LPVLYKMKVVLESLSFLCLQHPPILDIALILGLYQFDLVWVSDALQLPALVDPILQ